MADKRITIQLHGACIIRGLEPYAFEISGAKHKAIFALLATAPMGRRTRALLQEMLWGVAAYEAGRQNLRRAIADIKQVMGPAFAETITATGTELALDLDRVELVGGPERGAFLEGIEVRTPAFLRWLEEKRRPAAAALAADIASYTTPMQPAVYPLLPDKPSIAILPFTDLSDGRDQGHFVDGLVTDLIAALSCLPSLFVVPRDVSFRFRDRSVPLPLVGRELGVRYLIEGAVRHAGQRLRVTGELLEAETGKQLWSKRFDGDVDEVFDLQDKMTETVAAIIEPRLLFAEVERARRTPPANLEAHDLFLQATGHFYAMGRAYTAGAGAQAGSAGLPACPGSREDNIRAMELTDRALRLDPNNARNLALGALCRLYAKVQGWVPPTDPSIAEGGRMGFRAATRAPADPDVLWMAGITVALAGGDVASGIALLDRALVINPNSVDALTYSGMARAYAGDADVALQHLSRAEQLSPINPQTYNKHIAGAFATFGVGRYEESLRWSEKALVDKPDFTPVWRIRAASFGQLYRIDEAHEALLRMLALSPQETCASLRVYYSVSFKAPGAVDALVEGLRRAGLPPG